MSEICKECGKQQYHNIETDEKEEGVEIIHHSTASVIQINFCVRECPYSDLPVIKRSEQWMDYGIFERLYQAVIDKANGELNFLIKK